MAAAISPQTHTRPTANPPAQMPQVTVASRQRRRNSRGGSAIPAIAAWMCSFGRLKDLPIQLLAAKSVRRHRRNYSSGWAFLSLLQAEVPFEPQHLEFSKIAPTTNEKK